MATAQLSNYVAIEKAVANLITANMGLPCELGDFSKLTQSTPMAVIESGRMKAATSERYPNFQRLNWEICIHIFFDYTSDTEAHQLFSLYRVQLVQLFMQHRYLDDGNPVPAGYLGQAIDSNLTDATEPQYFEIEGKFYVGCKYTLWAAEQLKAQYP